MSATVNEKILNALNMYNEGLQEKISENYVEKELGKGLSTNDFTTAEKEKLSGLSNFDPETLSDTYATKSTIAGLSSVYVEKDGNKVLSENDFTAAYKNTLDNLSSTYVQKVQGKDLSENDFTNAYKAAIDGLSSTYATKSEISAVYKAKGSVADSSFLPTNATVGDVYNLLAAGGVDEKGIAFKAGDNAVWTGTGWDNLGGTIDLTGYVQKVSGKDLSSNDFTTAYKNTLDNLGSTYVQQVAGKGLSENDFTDDYKAAIDGLSSAGSNFDPETLSDTYVQKVAGKDLSSNDFTDADKTKLDNLPNISVFMKALLETNDATEARALLNVAREDIFDETGNRWNSLGAVCSPSEKKFGTNSLYMQASYLMNPTGITLGGKDFTIALWCYAEIAVNPIFNWGTSTSKIHVFIDQNKHFALITSANGSTVINVAMSSRTCAFTAGTWNHVELDYKNATGTFYLFFNGSLIQTGTDTSFQTARSLPIFIGSDVSASSKFTGYIDEFFVTEKLLHTANFTPPVAPYDLTPKTLALLHFDFDTLEYFTDDSGSYWLNLNAALSSTQKKFGSKSLDTSAGYLKKSALTLGGKDFAISAWFYSDKTITFAQGLIDWGDSANCLHTFRDANNKVSWNYRLNDTITFSVAMADRNVTFPAGQWNHIEIDYRHSDNTLFLFLNGTLVDSRTETSFSTARTFPLYAGTTARNSAYDAFSGYLDEVFVTEKLLHDADFTPPTDPHSADSDTLALLHFE